MKTRLTFMFATALAGMTAVGCGGTAVTQMTGPDVVRCQTTVTPPAGGIPSNGAQVNLSVAAARECTWNAASEASWMHVTPASGQGEASITLNVDANGTALARTGTIVLNDTRITVAQEPAPCRYTLSSSGERLSHAGGNTTVAVSTLVGCTWTAAGLPSWVRGSLNAQTGPGSASFAVDANPGPSRVAELTVAGERYVIQQDAPPPPPLPVAPPPGAPEPTPPAPTPPAPTPPAPTPPAPTPPAPTPPSPAPPAPTPPPATPPPQPPPAEPTPGRSIELEGRIRDLSGSCPNISFTLGGRTVKATNATRVNGGSCRSIRNGSEVEVRGTLMSDGTVEATSIRLEDDD